MRASTVGGKRKTTNNKFSSTGANTNYLLRHRPSNHKVREGVICENSQALLRTHRQHTTAPPHPVCSLLCLCDALDAMRQIAAGAAVLAVLTVLAMHQIAAGAAWLSCSARCSSRVAVVLRYQAASVSVRLQQQQQQQQQQLAVPPWPRC